MQKKLSKILSVVLAILMLISVLPMSATAETAVANGTCGDNLTWVLDSEGTLTISGNGRMNDYSSLTAPWLSNRRNIKKIIIDNGVTYISENALAYCSNLEKITVASDNKNYLNDEYGVLFNKEKSQLIICPAKIEHSYTVPDGVTSIANYAFYESELSQIILPDSLENIGDYAFYCCIFSEIKIPYGVTSIGAAAFNSCSNLTEISIPDSVTKIDHNTFSSCTSLKSVEFSKNTDTISGSMFSGCSALTEIIIPDTVQTIGNSAFQSCTSLEKITLPDKDLHIGYQAFLYSKYYDDQNNWENGVLYIGKHLINAQPDITESYTVKDETITIAEMSFWDTKVSSVTIPESVTVIGDNAFCYADNLTNISVAVNNKNFTSDDGILYNKNKDTLICYPCGKQAASFTVPESVTYIGNNAFRGNEYITSISLNENITAIGDCAFYMCYALSNINLLKNITVIGEYAFYACKGLTSIIIPSSVSIIAYETFGSCDNLTDVFIPASVKSIESLAFDENRGLKNVYYSGSQSEWNEINISETRNSALDIAVIHYNSCPENTQYKHSFDAKVTEPGCTEQGYTTYTCSCGYSYTADFVNEKGHQYKGAVTTPATHISTGVMTYTCTCGDSYTVTIEKLKEHSYSTVITKPTCTEEGFTTYTCICGNSYVSDYKDATGHSHKGVITTPATHTSTGVMTYTCVCGDSYTETIEKTTKHSYTSEITTPATHLTTGVMTFTCACGDSYTEAIEKLPGHTYNTELIKESTCKEDGKKYYYCECGHSYYETIFATGHKDKNGDIVCDECGVTYCSHLCHKSGILGFIWDIICFFQRLFGTNPVCECGKAHY